MASAISENAEALQARKSAAEAIREENDALTHEYVERREQGGVVENIPLGEVFTHMLVRDRFPGDEVELDSLVTSIKDLGLSNPIRVLRRPDGAGVELVQGYRRLSAYKALLAQDDDPQWATIPALVLAGDTDIGGLYRRMVDESVIRKDLSFAEMARAAQTYAMDPATDAKDLSDAVAKLFQSATYSKRSYIRSFAFLLDQIGEYLAYPTEVPRALGVTVARALKDRPEIKASIRDDLHDWDMRGLLDELDILRRHSGQDEVEVRGYPNAVVPVANAKRGAAEPSKTKTTFDIRTNAGRVKCTAGVGRLELKVDLDFSTIDRARLEWAIAALVDGLD
ncbi:MAG: ParB family chromosome partitioning protein [Akkermansiaceae bacterium]|jgi:ParB family chromosome partitioning protein